MGMNNTGILRNDDENTTVLFCGTDLARWQWRWPLMGAATVAPLVAGWSQ